MIYEVINFFKTCKLYYYNRYIRKKLNISKQHFYMKSEGFISGFAYINVKNNFFAFRGLRMEAIDEYQGEHFVPRIDIGENVAIGDFCHIAAINHVEIGNNVLMGSHILITDHQHGNPRENLEVPPINRKLYSKGEVIIGNNVWIGDNVVIMPDVIIGDNAIIGANSVVTKNVLSNAVVAGVPAKLVNLEGEGLDRNVRNQL